MVAVTHLSGEIVIRRYADGESLGRFRVHPKVWANQEDLEPTIAYLASDEAAFVQGAMVRVDGGRLDRL